MADANVTRWTRIPDYNNPQDMQTGLLLFDNEKCKQCGICSFICPARSIQIEKGPGAWRSGLPRLIYSYPGITDCIACGCCVTACPEEAISIKCPFNPGYFYQRLTQTQDLTFPKQYDAHLIPPVGETSNEKAQESAVKPGGGETPKTDARKWKLRRLQLLRAALTGAVRMTADDIREGRFIRNISAKWRKEPTDLSWAELLESRARQVPEKKFLLYEDETFTYRQMNENANRVANFLLANGGGKGMGLGIYMKNSPRFLDLFFGAQKIGMYLVPMNPELKGEGLAYLINHSDIQMLAADAELISSVENIPEPLHKVSKFIVDDVEKEAAGFAVPDHYISLSQAYGVTPDNPGVGYNPDDMCLIIYTSGTTGRPKGVVYRYKTSSVRLLMFYAQVLLKEDDVYYTCLPLCHGNALLITTTMSLARKATVALSRKFSASRFWDQIRAYDATIFNTIGSIIPILMKQPEKETERHNNVRCVFSAACPADMWEPFEKRFGVTLYEGYGAVDGGGKGIMNLGTAPVGSLGKPNRAGDIKIVDDSGAEVPTGETGELLFKVKTGGSRVEYYKNEEASMEKAKDGWLYTGDLVRQDVEGFVYFVGRNTESMRKSGENVSAYEVEHVIMKHPAVEDVAVYAVPSEMSEDEIMAAVKLVDGHTLSGRDLRDFLSQKLAKYAIPRYVRFVEEFPKTTSHRIIKRELEAEGVTADTYDANKE
ncbi:MAG: AMP-binding protein [Desulfobacterales bacterium]